MSEETKDESVDIDETEETEETEDKTDTSGSEDGDDGDDGDDEDDPEINDPNGDSDVEDEDDKDDSKTDTSSTDATKATTSTTNKKQYNSTGYISKKSAVVTNKAVTASYTSKELDKTPLYTPYVSSYGKTRDKDGGVTESEVATLKRYYSSIDAEIYFGNQYIEDICDIQWQLNQNHLPIFGYNSYTYDALAVGSRLVQGSFSIRFTTPNYLFKVLENLKQLEAVLNSSYKTQSHDRNVGEPTGNKDETTTGLVYGTKQQERWPQTFDIDIIYGKPETGFREVHVILQDVRILSCVSGASASSPVPVTETYSFVAHDIKTLS